MNKNYCLFTNDVETHSIWYNSLRDETGLNVLKEGMPRLLNIYSKYGIKTTFFFTGYIASKFPDVVKMVIKYGHEVASHGYSHEVNEAFDVLSYKKQVEHLRISKDILQNICGEEIISFRAPSLRINEHTAEALTETGYIIDSSVASQRFDVFMTFGSKNKLKWLTAPRKPYRTNPKDLFSRGNGNIIEVPLTAFLFPYVGTTMRIFPLWHKVQRLGVHFEATTRSKPVVFDIHPNEFLNEENRQRVVERRATNYLRYLYKDLLRSYLKVINLGAAAIPLYIDEIDFFKNREYKFLTIKEYVKQVFN